MAPDQGHFAQRIMAVREDADRELVALDLAIAIEWDDRFKAFELLSAGFHKQCPCVVMETGDVFNPLQFAVYHQRLSWIQMLLATGDFDVNCKTERDGNSLLHLSIVGADLEIIRILIDAGVNINAVNKIGQTALALSTIFHDLEIFTLLLEKNAKVDVQTAFSACSFGNPDGLAQILKYPDLLINELGSNGQSVLHLSIRNHFSTCVPLVLGYPGVNVNIAETETGWTALHLCCKNQLVELSKIILLHGANPLATDHNLNLPRVFIKNDSVQLYKILFEAESRRRAVDISILILAASKDLNGGLFQYLPLEITSAICSVFFSLAYVENVMPEMLDSGVQVRENRLARIARAQRTITSEQAIELISETTILKLSNALDSLDVNQGPDMWNQSVVDLKQRLEDASADVENGFYIPHFVIQSLDSLRDVSLVHELDTDGTVDLENSFEEDDSFELALSNSDP
jgi:ankyrin repeat protein